MMEKYAHMLREAELRMCEIHECHSEPLLP